MTKNEREDLAKLCRQREKLAKAEADVRAAEMRADFEKQLAAIHNYDDHAVLQRAFDAAEAAVKKAQEAVEATLKDLGIPRQFGPELSLHWYRRGKRGEETTSRVDESRGLTNRCDYEKSEASNRNELCRGSNAVIGGLPRVRRCSTIF